MYFRRKLSFPFAVQCLKNRAGDENRIYGPYVELFPTNCRFYFNSTDVSISPSGTRTPLMDVFVFASGKVRMPRGTHSCRARGQIVMQPLFDLRIMYTAGVIRATQDTFCSSF